MNFKLAFAAAMGLRLLSRPVFRHALPTCSSPISNAPPQSSRGRCISHPHCRISGRRDAARKVRHGLPPALQSAYRPTSAGQSHFRRLAVRCPRRRMSAAFPRTVAVSRIPAMRLCHDRALLTREKLRDDGAGIGVPKRYVGAVSTVASHLSAVQYAGPVPQPQPPPLSYGRSTNLPPRYASVS
jgi:hypothetical protein